MSFGGILDTLPQEVKDRFFKGDPNCKFKVGSKVIKVVEEYGDHHKLNEIGEVVGNTYFRNNECYFVNFNNSGVLTFILGYKLEQHDEI